MLLRHALHGTQMSRRLDWLSSEFPKITSGGRILNQTTARLTRFFFTASRKIVLCILPYWQKTSLVIILFLWMELLLWGPAPFFRIRFCRRFLLLLRRKTRRYQAP